MLEKLFTAALEISVTSSIAILLISLFSLTSEKKYSAKWRYWVWAVIALRLIIPVGFSFESAPVKVDMPRQEMVIVREAPTENDMQQTGADNADAGVQSGAAQNNTIKTPVKAPAAAEPQITEKYTFSIMKLGAVIWLAGAAAAFAWNIFAYLRFCKCVMRWNRAVPDEHAAEAYREICAEMKLERAPEIYMNKMIKSPMMVGYTNPKILLPAQNFCGSDYEVVLRHELTHFKRRDLWYKLLLAAAKSLHWFNPVVYMMCKKADNDIEISCDEAVVRQKSLEFRREYCETILRIMKTGKNSPLMLSTGFYGGAAVLKKRFSAVLKENSKRGAVLFAAALVLMSFCGTLVACQNGAENEPMSTAEPPAAEDISQSGDEETNPLPPVTGPNEDGEFPEIEGYLFDRWVTYGDDETEVPKDEPLKFMESKHCVKWLHQAYPGIDDWEVLFERDTYTLRTDEYDPYSYSWRDQYLPNRIVVLKTEQGNGFDRLFVVSIDQYSAIMSDDGIIPMEETLCYKIEASESEVEGGDFSGAETVGLENWYPTIWLINDNRALLLDFNMEIVVNASGMETKPPVVEFVYSLKNGFYLTDNITRLSTVPENEKDMIVYLKSETSDERYASTVVYYDYETKKLIPFEDGEPDESQSGSYTQTFFLTDNVLCLMNQSRISLYDILSTEPGKPFSVLSGNGGEISENQIQLLGSMASDRDFGERHTLIYYEGSNPEFHVLTFGTDGKVISNFPLGLIGGSIGSYNFASGVLYFTYYPDGSGYGPVHYSVDTRPSSEHILENLD